ncbi:MAG: cation-translocating P-type ATPase [Simkaniaceae bacterium]|nr:cation-translocating P-type ATPase [Simkaniaceae bacterium]
MKRAAFRVEGLCCTDEMAILRKSIEPLAGIRDVDFDLVNGKMLIEYHPDVIQIKEIIALVKKAGYRASPWEQVVDTRKGMKRRFGRHLASALSALFLILGLIFPSYFWLYILSVLAGVWYVVPKALKAVKNLRPDINLLMVIAVVGALFIHEFFEGATTAFLFSIALLLEHWSLEKARKSIANLLDIAPKTANRIDPSTKHIDEVALDEIQIGDHVLIRPGEKIPVDGTITSGATSINQAPITGESVPVDKEVDDVVYAGTINESGVIECIVTKHSDDTALARMIKLIEEAQSKRAASQQWVEKFALFYTPMMIIIALLICLVPPLLFGGAWDEWIYRALVVLVIACPCSLVISTPVSIVSALTLAAREGVLIKGGKFMELPAKIDVIAMDKTGTLTYGKPEVQSLTAFAKGSKDKVLKIAGGLVKTSTHPLSRAIMRYIDEPIPPMEGAQEVAGKGMRSGPYWIGSHRLMLEFEAGEPEQRAQIEKLGSSVVIVGKEKQLLGFFTITDFPRENIAEIIEGMRKNGADQVLMLTGDNEVTAKDLADQCKLDGYYSELLPEEKLKKIEELLSEGKAVAMVGDGINDAPAMALATLSIAMGAVGSDAAIETADIALMSDDVAKIPWLMRLSKRTLAIIKQNISASLIVKGLFLIMSCFGLATLWMAILADTGMSLLVIMNGLRLLKNPRSA